MYNGVLEIKLDAFILFFYHVFNINNYSKVGLEMKVFAKFGPEGMKDQENRELGKIELERNGFPVTRRL